MEQNSQPKKDKELRGGPMGHSLATIFEQQVQEDISKAKHIFDVDSGLKEIGVGIAVVIGTGGEMADSMQELHRKLFRDPQKFNYKNIEEENLLQIKSRRTGFFTKYK